MPHTVHHYEPQPLPPAKSLTALPPYVREFTSWKGLEKLIPQIINDFRLETDLAIEFGVWHGYSTAALGSYFSRVIGADIFTGDVIPGTEGTPMVDTTRKSLEAWPNVELQVCAMENFDYTGLPVADLIHIDASHNYKDWFGALKACAHAKVIIFHDTGNWFQDVPRLIYELAESFGLEHFHFPHHEGLDIIVTTEESRAKAQELFDSLPGLEIKDLPLLEPHSFAEPPGKMVLGIVSGRHWKDESGSWEDCIRSWDQNSLFRYPRYHVTGKPIMEAYNEVYRNTRQEIISYIHDDVSIYENSWDQRVLKEFDDPTVGLVGFFGALGHCQPNLYEGPCKGANFVRFDVRSNMVDAEIHGQRFDAECDVAVLDGLALFVRRQIIDKMGGWPEGTPIGYWVYDYLLCCEARRQGYRIRMVGVNCRHHASKTLSYNSEDWEGAHQYLYDNYRDVLPARV